MSETILSVCITSFNTLEPLKAKLELLRSELHDINHEILVYDQASTDGTRQYLNTDGAGTRVYFGEHNAGQCISRNYMLAKSTGKYVMFLDGDIVPIPGSVKAMLHYLMTSPRHGVAYDIKGDTRFPEDATQHENSIRAADIKPKQMLYFHYAMYRREFIVQHPLPEFAPFNAPGWGAEEDIAHLLVPGHQIAIIQNRKFYHHRSGGSRNFIPNWPATRAQRLAILAMFTDPKFDLRAAYANKLPMVTPLKLTRPMAIENCVIGDAATEAITRYLPYRLTDGALLIFGHDYLAVPPTAKVCSIPALYSPLWLHCCTNMPVWDTDGLSYVVTSDLSAFTESGVYSLDTYIEALQGRRGVETDDMYVFILTALLGMPVRWYNQCSYTWQQRLAEYGLHPIMNREQCLAFRQLRQNTVGAEVIFPLTKMLLNHV